MTNIRLLFILTILTNTTWGQTSVNIDILEIIKVGVRDNKLPRELINNVDSIYETSVKRQYPKSERQHYPLTISESFWVYYKLWGGFALTLVNIIASALYLSASGLLDELPPATDGDGAATTAAALSDTALPQPGATGDTDLADGQSRHGNGGRT